MMVLDQETFDLVLNGMRAQGGPSAVVDSSGHGVQCLYRGPNGRKCAVGLIIPDKDYNPSIEGTTASKALGMSLVEGTILDGLQRVHDRCAYKRNASDLYDPVTDEEFFAKWEPAMKSFAEKHNLHYTPPVVS